MSPSCLACITVATIVALSHGSEFLTKRVSEHDIQESFLAEVEARFGKGGSTSRVHVLEETLKPMYAVLPKNEHGNLGHSTVRYALHRLFILRHGWSIKGLGRDVVAQNSTSPNGVLKDQVPAYIQDMVEERLGEKGLGLQELAVLASTMEHLIHQESVGKLGEIFNMHHILPTEHLSKTKATEMLDTFMMAYILGPEEIVSELNLRDAPNLIASWPHFRAFARRIHDNMTAKPKDPIASSASFGFPQLDAPVNSDFPMLAKVVEAVGERFGTFQNDECQELKRTLMQIEIGGIGRARLADFYRPGLLGNWQFMESAGYLRQLGALDESDPNDLKVIIVNYLLSQSNCIGFSGFYSVCCKDECEGLFGHLEQKIHASEATVAAIIENVENLPSSTVNASRKLSPTLLKRLEEIAAEHAGMVPLHGRLFAQWMHHAYPRECPYPHLSGTTNQQTDLEYERDTGFNAKVPRREIIRLTAAKQTSQAHSEDEILPWSPEEELFVVRSTPQPKGMNSRFDIVRRIALLVGASFLALSIAQTLKTSSMLGKGEGDAKFFV